MRAVCQRIAALLTPAPKSTPDVWGGEHRVYPPSAGIPGPRDPWLTPYIIAFERFFDEPRYEEGVLVTGTQMSKTDGALDVIGWQLDTRPRPILYIGPSRDFVTEQFEPRLMALIEQSSRLSKLLARGKRNKKFRKIVNGVPIRLAWAGSPASLASDQAGLVLVDELSKMFRVRQKAGDPFVLGKARADTYADRKIAAMSTPENGTVGIEKDGPSGLEFWAKADTDMIECATWKRWQAGTRHHWAWRCPHCAEWFIPRYRDLRCDCLEEGTATPAIARRTTYLACPANGCVIEEAHKEAMNAGGQFVAPGEFIRPDGTVGGDPADSTTISWWASGLASPFLSWGERVAEVLAAKGTGDPSTIKAAMNKVGELYSPIPAMAVTDETYDSKVGGFRLGDVPPEVLRLVMGVDVQGNRLVYVVRGFGSGARSWLIDAGEIWGPTREEEVWAKLGAKLQQPIAGLRIERLMIDSGFRPDKREAGDYHKVYAFCRRWPWLATPTKGQTSQSTPVVMKKVEVTADGRKETYGITLAHVDTDYFKGLVHSRIWTPAGQPGAFLVPEMPDDLAEKYRKQLLSESRGDDGKWHSRYRENHFFDAEVLAAVGGFLIKAHAFPEGMEPVSPPADKPASPKAPFPKTTGSTLRDRMAARAQKLNAR